MINNYNFIYIIIHIYIFDYYIYNIKNIKILLENKAMFQQQE